MSDKPWGGVFDQATDQRVEKFTESVSFDRRLYAHDIRGSIAHANMLSKVGVLTDDERHQIVTGLEQIGHEIAAGRFQFRQELEDIHMNVERTLTERIGDVGRKLHTGRSRNDQISNDIRLWVRDEIDAMSTRLELVQRAFIGRADTDAGVVLPAYTHLQRAQPVLAAHYWLAYCEKLERERERLADCRNRVNQMSLGSAALAGTSIPIDRHMVADELEFDGILANSLDGSSDRDFVLEFAFCLASIATHLSGWAEEWILWSTTEFGFLRLPQKFCTGSSIMPQKINPDVLELIRGKTGRVVGNLMALLTILKGLPQAYNRDLQEDKERLFDSVDTVAACLDLAAPIVAGAELNRDAIAARLERGLPRRHHAHGTPHHERCSATNGPRNHRPPGRHRHETRRPARRAATRRFPVGPRIARRKRLRSVRRSACRRSNYQLRFDQSGTSRTPTGHLARTLSDNS